MKLLQVLDRYQPDHVGAAAVHAHRLARVLSARGHEVVSLFTDSDPRVARFTLRARTLDGVRLLEVVDREEVVDVSETWKRERYLPVFSRVLESERPEVVHFHGLHPWGAACISLAREEGLATVATMHDYRALCDRGTLLHRDGRLCDPGDLSSCTSCLLARRFQDDVWGDTDPAERHRLAVDERLAFHRRHIFAAQRVIAPSPFTKEALLAADVVRDGRRVITLENGYPGPLREPRTAPEDGPLRVGYIGSLHYAKGVHVLVKAMQHLDGEPVELEIHGPLADYPEYVAELRSSSEGYPVRFAGRFAPEDIDRVLARFDLLVVPSIAHETSPAAIHEAWRNGLPVVASDLGGLGEALTHGTNGLLFGRHDATGLAEVLRSLAGDRELLDRLARGRPELATVEGAAQKLESIYHECLDELRTEAVS